MGKTQINLQVNEAQKERWEDYLEESPNAESMSQLIRLSVEHEIKHQRAGQPMQQSSSEIQLSDDSEVVGTLQSIQNTIKSMDERMGVLERENQSDSYDLQRVVYEMIPIPDMNMPDPSEYDHPDGGVDAQDVPRPREYGITPGQLAKRINADTERVRDALDGLSDATSSVKRSVGDSVYYWRSE